MTTTSSARAYAQTERVRFQTQTRAETGPFRNYGEPHGSWIITLANAEDASNFSEGVRIIAFLDRAYYATVWVDGIEQGSAELYDPAVAKAMRRSDASNRAAALTEELREEINAHDDLLTPAEWTLAEALFRVACERMPGASDKVIRGEVEIIWTALGEMNPEREECAERLGSDGNDQPLTPDEIAHEARFGGPS